MMTKTMLSTTANVAAAAAGVDDADRAGQGGLVPPRRRDRDTPAARLARELLPDDQFDELLARSGDGGVRLTGEGGFLPELLARVLERGMDAELSEHLGYERGDPAGRGSPNSRNGATPKTVVSEVGEVSLATPRDRAGTFEPRLVPKGARRLAGLDA